jgi:hypothetical protein
VKVDIAYFMLYNTAPWRFDSDFFQFILIGKLAKPRQLHNSHWGMMCPAETPEGQVSESEALFIFSEPEVVIKLSYNYMCLVLRLAVW